MPKQHEPQPNFTEISSFIVDRRTEPMQHKCAFIDTVLNGMNALLVVVDGDRRIVLFNQACEKLTGYTFDEVKDRDIYDLFILPEERAEVQAVVDKLLATSKGERPHLSQNIWLTRDGEKKYISWSASILSSGDGKPPFVVCSGTDLTEQVKSKKALEQSESLFSALFEQAHDAIFIAEVLPDGTLSKYIEVNDLACQMLGYSRQELMQFSPHTLPMIDGDEKRDEVIDKNIDKGNFTADLTMVAKDGSKIPFELNTQIFQANDKILTMGICRDITERKKAEAVLQESEERYRSLVELSPDAIFVHRDGRFVYGNSATATLFGVCDSEGLMGKPIDGFMHPDSKDEVYSRLSTLQRGEKITYTLEEKIIRDDGSVVDVEVACSPLNYHGSPAMQVIMRDISNRKKMEQELLKVSKLKSLGTLAGSIAHEYNNLLTVILGNLSIARMYAKQDAKVSEILMEVEAASGEARELTQRLLTFARGGKPIKKTLNIHSLLLKSGLGLLDDGHISYSLKLQGDLLPVEADDAQICQVINDIILNAVQAMPNGGTVKIAAENATSENIFHLPVKDGLYVKITISDDGPGVAAESLTSIFDPFYTTKPESNGLGLATAYSIIKRHEGHLTVESVEGEGATFLIYLPAIQSMEIPTDEDEPEFNGRGKVLVMDDEAAIRKTAQEMLRLLGYEAAGAADGAEAIALFREAKEAGEPFDLVILDLVVMGGMGGMETITALQEMDPEVNAYVSSGYSNDPVISDYQGYGFSGCLPKPYTIEQLGAALKKSM